MVYFEFLLPLITTLLCIHLCGPTAQDSVWHAVSSQWPWLLDECWSQILQVWGSPRLDVAQGHFAHVMGGGDYDSSPSLNPTKHSAAPARCCLFGAP